MTKYSFFKFVLFACCVAVLSSCGVKARLKKADKRYAAGNYFEAASIYRSSYSQVTKNKPLRANIAFKMGHCYRLYNNNARSETSFANAIRNGVEDSTVHLYYAEALRKNGKYAEAKTQYETYLRFDPEDKIWALNGILSCEKIPEWRKEMTRYEVRKADKFNSRRGDFCPVFGEDDGSSFYFTSSRDAAKGRKNSTITGLKNNDIFYSKTNASGAWENIQALPEVINTTDDEGACCFSADGRTMYFTRCRSVKGETLGGEIYSSSRAGGEWSEPLRIMLLEDSTITIAHPAISQDNNTLYFVSDMPGGLGGKDIWKVEKNGDDWSKPVNMGAEINTPGDEMFPSIRANGVLYFSSNGHPGFGGLDIFTATPVLNNPDKEWEVENMMMPINSQWDDFGITFAGKQERGFFSSNRNEPKGYDKIYSFELPAVEYMLEGKVTENREPVSNATVRIIGDNGTNAKIHVRKDGSYRFKLEKDVSYIMLASARGYLNRKNTVSTLNQTKSKTYTVDFELTSVYRPVPINNIFFEFGKATLTPESENALNGLVTMLKDNPNICIEIGAHTDMVGSDALNLTLSARRAEAVIYYLIKEGIDGERVAAKGYGKSSPAAVSRSNATQYPFLKEGDTLDEQYIAKLTDEQKEIANQINRRIEFRVTKTTYKLY